MNSLELILAFEEMQELTLKHVVDFEVESVYFYPSLFILSGHRQGFTELGKIATA